MAEFRWSTRFVAGAGGNVVDGVVKAPTITKARAKVFDSLRSKMKFKGRLPTLEAALNTTDRRFSLVDAKTGNTDIFEGGRWHTKAGVDRRGRRIQSMRDEVKRRGFRVSKATGVVTPPEPLIPRKFTLVSGEDVPGSTGNVMLLMFEQRDGKETAIVTDAVKRAHFWPAVYNPDEKRWEATGDGERLEGGKIVERFPIPRRVMVIERTTVHVMSHDRGFPRPTQRSLDRG